MKVRKLLAGILSAAMVLGTMVLPVSAETFEVTDNETLSTAIVNLKSGDTIKLKTGTYDHFDICDKDNITIEGADENTVVTVNSVSNFAFIGANCGGDGVTVRNISFVAPATVNNKQWRTAIIGPATESEGDPLEPTCYTVKNCKFTNQNDTASAIAFAIFAGRKFDITGCEFDNFTYAISMMEDNHALQESKIDSNKFTKCDCALLGYWGQPSTEGEGISFVNNIIESAKSGDVAYVQIQEQGVNGKIQKVVLSGNTYNTSTIVDLTDVSKNVVKNTETSDNVKVVNNFLSEEKALAGVGIGEKFYIKYDYTKDNVEYTKVTETKYTGSDGSVHGEKPVKIGDVGYETLGAATAAAKDGDVITIIGKVDVAATDFPAGKSLSFAGQDRDSSILDFTNAQSIGVSEADLTFKNLTINRGQGDYHGLQHSNAVLYEDCTINGRFNLYGKTETFNRCKFVQDTTDYNLWTYGAGVASFNNCDFLGNGRSIYVYNEYYQNDKVGYTTATPPVVNITSCTFTATNAVSGKAAVEIGSNFCPFEVNISKSTATGYSENTLSGSMLYNVKAMKTNLSDGKLDKTKVTVDDKVIDLTNIRKQNSEWTYDTDSGYFTVDGAKSGVMRFMFKVQLDKAIKSVGIKYINANNIPESLSTTGAVTVASNNIKAFQGDIANITEGAADGKYFAAAYVVTSDNATIWSDLVECSMNWAQEFTTDGGAE